MAGYAISAVDVALWDLKAKLLGLPLYRLLGAVRADVPVYGSGGFTAYDEGQLREQLSGWVSGQRIPRVKIKIGESWGTGEARDLARMRQARETVGGAAAAIPNFRHLEWFHDHVRIESMFFDGTLDPSGGSIRPDPGRPGLGLTFRSAGAEPYRVG